jgi:hypothetical protein
MNLPSALLPVQAGQVGAVMSGAQEQAALGLTVGMALGATLAGIAGVLGAGAGAMHVDAHVGHLHTHDQGATAGSAGSFGFVYVPDGAPAQSIRLREPRTSATEKVKVHANGLLVFRAELVAEAAGEKHAPVVHGHVGARGHRP